MVAYLQSTLVESANISSSTTTNGPTIPLNTVARDFIVISELSSCLDGTYVTSLQHSFDGENWFTVDSVGAQITNSSKVVRISSEYPILRYVRASIASSTVISGATISVYLCYSITQ